MCVLAYRHAACTCLRAGIGDSLNDAILPRGFHKARSFLRRQAAGDLVVLARA